MKTKLLLLSMWLLCSVMVIAQANYLPGEFIVQIKPNKDVNEVVRHFQTFNGKTTKLRVKKKLVPTLNIYLLSFDFTKITQPRLLDAMFKHTSVNIIQNNHITQHRATIPNDPQFNNQWQYINTGASGGVVNADLDAELAWDITTGGVTALGDTIVVCVVDDGLDLTHTDFASNRWFNYAEIPGNGIDDDGNGYTDDYRGWNTDNNTDDIAGGFFGGFHGTPVAGIVGAKGNNAIGVSGVNWNVKLMIVVGGSGNEADNIAAYSYPLTMRTRYNETNGAQGAFVVATNSSWGTDFGQPADAPLWCAMYDEMGAQGILSAGATANVNVNVDIQGDLPTACPSDYLISVTNLRRNDVKVTSAGYGITTIDLGAYGEDTWTVAKPNNYAGFGGTSGATPHVAGAVALLYSAPCYQLAALARTNPAEAALLVKQFILDGTTPNASLAGITVTGGRLNMHNALQLAMSIDCADTGCPSPYALQASNITDVNATVTWNTSAPVGNFIVQYKPANEVNWNVTTATANAVSLSGLLPCTAYQVSVASVCDTIASGFSFTYTFTTQGCCVPPSAVTFSGINTNSAVVNWTDVFGALAYLIEYRPVGATAWLSVSGDAGSAAYTLTDLIPCQQYELRMATFCSTFAYSANSAVFTFSTFGCGACIDLAYCPSISEDDSYEHVQNVTLGSFTNSSGESGGYANFTNLTTTATLTAGESYPISLIPGFSGATYEEYWRVWIDYNQDGIFTDQTELAFDSGSASSATVTGAVVVPITALPGSTRMRVSMKWFEDDLTPPSPCETFAYGEVEDYCVLIEAGSACAVLVPANLSAQDVSTNGALLSWTGAPSCQTYTLQYSIQGSANWTTIADITTQSYTVSGLTDATFYQFQVQCNCSDGLSAFSPPFTFITEQSCLSQIPANVTIQNVGETGAQAAWDALPFCVSYTVRYRIIGTADWQVIFSANNSTTLSALTPGSNYELSVSCNCDDGSGNFSDTVTFNTFNTGISPTQPQPTLLQAYPSPFTTEIAIHSQYPAAQSAQLMLIDISGKIVWHSETVQLTNGISRYALPNLPDGLYVLQVKDAYGALIHAQKMLKMPTK